MTSAAAHRTGAASSASIQALTGLRGYAALWVVLSHLSYTDTLIDSLGTRFSWGRALGVIQHEYLAVDLFFMLSGFVLTHVHAHELDEGVTPKVAGRFLLLRLARIYPLHLLGLLLSALMIALKPGQWDPLAATRENFLYHLALIDCWGFAQSISFNTPAWSLSAEWFAYLVFPLVAMGTASARTIGRALGTVVVLFVLFHLLMFHGPERDYSNGVGALTRVVIGVAIGSLLRRLYAGLAHRGLPWGLLFWILVPLSLCTMVTAEGLRRAETVWAVIPMAGLLLTASLARGRAMLPFTHPIAIYLGEISFAIYILHHPLLRTLRWLLDPRLSVLVPRLGTAGAWGLLIAAVASVIAVSAAAHRWIEAPVRAWGKRKAIERFGR